MVLPYAVLSVTNDIDTGYLIQILSFGAFLSLATGNPAKFAIVYSIGNLLAFAAYSYFNSELVFYWALKGNSKIWLIRRGGYAL